MDSCTGQMLEMEQPHALYSVGRALRSAFQAGAANEGAGDEYVLLARIDAATAASCDRAAQRASSAA